MGGTPASPFRIIAIPDTQYLFDGTPRGAELLQASLDFLMSTTGGPDDIPVLHIAHLGDVSEHGTVHELETAASTMAAAAARLGPGVSWSFVAGNHDVDPRFGDERGLTPFLDFFGPGSDFHRGRDAVFSPCGYNSWHTLRTPAGPWGMLSMDWRPSQASLEWARGVLGRHPGMPTVLLSHDLAYDGSPTPNGRHLLDELVDPYPQVFLAVGGHEWPATRMLHRRRDGSAAEVHTANYQDLMWGGAGMIREYLVDPRQGKVRALTHCPALSSNPTLRNSVAARRELSAVNEADVFGFELPGRSGTPWQVPKGMRLVLETSWGGDTVQLPVPLSAAGAFVLAADFTLPANDGPEWATVVAAVGPQALPDHPLAAMGVSTERFICWQSTTADGGPVTSFSHAMPSGTQVNVVVAAGTEADGLWVNGEPVLRDELRHGDPPGHRLPGAVEGWMVGAAPGPGGTSDGISEAFSGSVQRLRLWYS